MIFWRIYVAPLPNLTLLILLAVLLWGAVMQLLNGRVPVRRIINAVLFLFSVAVIARLTLVRSGGETASPILRPLHFLAEARKERELYRSMLMNVFLFVPFGMTLPFVFSPKLHFRRLLTLLCALLLSAAVEWLQYRFALGRCEVDDVLMNGLGAIIGAQSLTVCLGLRRLKAKRRND